MTAPSIPSSRNTSKSDGSGNIDQSLMDLVYISNEIAMSGQVVRICPEFRVKGRSNKEEMKFQ